MPETFSAPLAIIRAGSSGTAIGKIRNLQFQEQIQRANVQGLGVVTLQEVPATLINCSFSASSYAINLKKFGTIQDPFWPVEASSAEQLLNAILLGDVPVQIHVYKRIPVGGRIPANFTAQELLQNSEVGEQTIGIIQDAHLNSRTFEIAEGQVAGKNITGVYLTPIWNTGD